MYIMAIVSNFFDEMFVCVLQCQTRLDYICNMEGVLSEAETAYHQRAPKFTPGFGKVLVAHFLAICVLFRFFFVLVVFVLRLVSPILLVSLYCPFLIAPSAFTIVFFILDQHTQFEYCRCGSLTQHSTGRHVAILYMKINFILQSVYLLYKYAIRIHFYFIRTRRINFSYYTNKLSWYPVAMYSGGHKQV